MRQLTSQKIVPKQLSEIKTIKISCPKSKKYANQSKIEVQYVRVPKYKLNTLHQCFIKYSTDSKQYKSGYIIKNCHPKYLLLKNFKMNTIWALNLRNHNLHIYEKKSH